jgi:hypothetical protein
MIDDVSHDFLPKMVRLLGGDQGNITTPILRAITNLIAGDEDGDAIAQELIDCDMLPAIRFLLDTAGYTTRLECLLVVILMPNN